MSLTSFLVIVTGPFNSILLLIENVKVFNQASSEKVVRKLPNDVDGIAIRGRGCLELVLSTVVSINIYVISIDVYVDIHVN